MDDKWAVPKVLLLLCLVVAAGFVAFQNNRIETELVDIRNGVRAQSKILEELGVALRKSPMRQGTTQQAATYTWGDGILKADGRNCLRDPMSIQDPTEGGKDSGTLNLHLKTEVPSMTGLLENSADLSDIETLVKMGLFGRQFMEDGELRFGGIAHELKITEDFKVYTFKLRDDFYWHSPAVDLNNPKYAWIRDLGPQKVTAHDFAFTAMRIVMNPDSQCSVTRSSLEMLDKVEALDDTTLRITWKEKTYPSLTASELGWVQPKFLFSRDENGLPIPDEVLGQAFNEHWYNKLSMIGCGPYRFVEYEKGKRLILERNESYPLRKPRFQRIEYTIVKTPEGQLARFKNGDIDIMELDPAQYAAEIHKIKDDPKAQAESPFYNGKVKWKLVETPGFSYIGWNLTRELLKDKLVRRALTHALPVKKLLQDVWMGYGEEITGPIHKFSPDYDKSLEPLAYDLGRAGTLLDEAGWRDTDGDGIRDKLIGGKKRDLEVEILHFAPMPEYDQMFGIYGESLLKIGVRMIHTGLDWPNFMKRMEERNFDAVCLAWMLNYDTDLRQIWHSESSKDPKGSNRIMFCEPEVDAIIDQSRVTFDPLERRKLFHKFHHIFYDLQPYTLWRARKAVLAWQSRLGEIRIDTRRPQTDPTEFWDHSK
ncbi:MAG: ABC transporter substrate-binding protein [Planctomycetota bacterium]